MFEFRFEFIFKIEACRLGYNRMIKLTLFVYFLCLGLSATIAPPNFNYNYDLGRYSVNPYDYNYDKLY